MDGQAGWTVEQSWQSSGGSSKVSEVGGQEKWAGWERICATGIGQSAAKSVCGK